MRGIILTPEEHGQIFSILSTHIERRAAALLRSDPRTVYRGGLGLPLQRNSADRLRARLDAISKAEAGKAASSAAAESALSTAASKHIRRHALHTAARLLDVDPADLLSAAVGDELCPEVQRDHLLAADSRVIL
jgi:hypothetical protein